MTSLCDTPSSWPLTTLANVTNHPLATHPTPHRYSLDPPARSRFLAFGINRRRRSETAGRSQKGTPKLEDNGEEELRGLPSRVSNRVAPSVLCEHAQHPTFHREAQGHSPVFPGRSSLVTREFLSYNPPTITTLELFPKSRDYYSLLVQTAAEAQSSFAKLSYATRAAAVFGERDSHLSLSPESNSSGSSASTLLPPLESLSEGSANTTYSPEFAPPTTLPATCAPCEAPARKDDWVEYWARPAVHIRPYKFFGVIETIGLPENRRVIERMVTKPTVAGTCESRSKTPHSVHLSINEDTICHPPTVATLGSYATSTDIIESGPISQNSTKPADFYVRRAQERIRSQRVTPWRRAREDPQRAPSVIPVEAEDTVDSPAAERVSKPRVDITKLPGYRGDQNVTWPTPPPSALLRPSVDYSPVSFSRPFVFHPTFDVNAVAASSDWPSPPPSSLLVSDLPQFVPGMFPALFVSCVSPGPAVVDVREEPTVRAPKPWKPIPIGLMEHMVHQWEEEGDDLA